MIENLRSYESYRASGIAWAPSLPAHWKTQRAKGLFRKVNRPVQPGDDVVTCFRDGVVTLRKNRRVRGFTEAIHELGYQGIRRGDLVIHAMDAFAGAAGVSDSDGKGTPVYAVCEARPGAVSAYYAYVVREMARSQWILAISRGIRERSTDFRFDVFGVQRVPLPPVDEQAAVVCFLEHANRRIGQFIRAKRKLIALLNQQKRAIIHLAVTRGLDPSVPMKDSGSSWLPRIPASWKRSRLKFETTNIVDCLHATPSYVPDGTFPAIRTADIEPGRVRLAQARRVSAEEYALWTSRLEPKEGDILYSREGERYGIAASVPANIKLCISQRMMVFRVGTSQDAEYFMWQLNCPHVYAQASVYISGSTSPHVNVEQIRNFELVVPPLEEQRRIAAHIRVQTNEVDAVSVRTERELDLIREYRTRLIADVVTGQLDVRMAAASLPIGEPEPNGAGSDESLNDDEEDDFEGGEAA